MPLYNEPPDGGAAPPTAEEAIEQLKAEEAFLEEISRDYKRLQKQKSRRTGGVEARVLLARAAKFGEQFVKQQANGLVIEQKGDDNSVNLYFNLIEPACSKLQGRLASIGGQYSARPDKKDPKALAEAEIVDKLLLALDEKLDQPDRNWELFETLLTDGVAFEYVPWIPDCTKEPMPVFDEISGELMFIHEPTQQEVPQSQRDEMVAQGLPLEQFSIKMDLQLVGDVGSEVYSALDVFVDSSVKSIDSLAPDQAVYIARIKTFGWIEENYPGKVTEDQLGGKLSIVTTSVFDGGDNGHSCYLRDLLPRYQGEMGEDDPKMAVVVERYQPSSKVRPAGRFTCFIPNLVVLFDGDNPYGEIPLVDFHLHPIISSFWTKDFVTDLIPAQRFINKRLSQVAENANATFADKILLGGALSAKDLSPDAPQAVEKAINEQGVPLVQRPQPAQLPTFHMDSIKLVGSIFQQIGGGNDLFGEHKFPGQFRGSEAIPFLQEILDSGWGPLYRHLGKQFAKVKQQRLNRVKQFYPPVRTLNYTGSDQRDEVLVFHTEKILKSGTNFNVTVEPSSLIPEFRSVREARVAARVNSQLGILYTDDRTGRLSKSKLADAIGMVEYGREGKEVQSRKFIRQLMDKMWKGEGVPAPMPFWDHEPMLDELEAAMQTTEWLAASGQVQQLFIDQWNAHAQLLQQRMQAQQDAAMQGAVQNAVAQATQQAAAMAASSTVHATQEQIGAQDQLRSQQPDPIAMLIQAQGGGLKGLGGQEAPQNGQKSPRRL